jgi:ribonuclease BN (tRNA processing enzyme)
VVVEAPDGTRLGYTGDTGPSDSVVAAMRGVDLLLVEAALADLRYDDPERGHLMADEAIAMVVAAEARAGLLVHYGPGRRADLEALCASATVPVRVALDGLTITVTPPDRRSMESGSATASATATSA